MKKRVFMIFDDIPAEKVGRHKDGSCCNRCIFVAPNRSECTSNRAPGFCGANGRFIAVNPDDEAFLLARLKGEI